MMMMNGCSSLVTPSLCPISIKSKSLKYRGVPPLPSRVSCQTWSSWRPFKGPTLQSSIGKNRLQHCAAAPTLFSGNDYSFPHSTMLTMGRQKQRRPFLAPPRASIEMPWSNRYPASKGEKVEWWWRILACLPYLMTLHNTEKHLEAAYRLFPALKQFEFLTSGFYRAFERLPRWFLMVYFVAACFGVVRRKELPHFLRFGTMMSMLLEYAIQIIETTRSFVPFAFYGGWIGYEHFSIVLGVIYVLTVLLIDRLEARLETLRYT
ncbi:hypothetical protein Vadar_016134 [Vaccinium darrowii]|uniref:Uncharacterized protein n=1 Tax=Vaccinium darrowii TaxID=229202 RepID=A0ACB7YM05_9ERIC|nr:hypothetical protein Vadar_016134 [Vaccinium darrowii]